VIQNADDSDYGAFTSLPALKIHCDAKQLTLWCNEDGFTRSNVDAICRVGQSTKKSKGCDDDSSVRYIGEKGVGFKSVFKVADAVWIKSGKYSFKFDKRRRLGMIVPLWDQFPVEAPDEGTSMLLHLSAGCDIQELLSEIKDFNYRSLIFLRKLRQLVFSLTEQSGERWESTVVREVEVDPESKLETVELKRGTSCERYLVTKHLVTGLPVEPKREGLTSTEVRLAFPITVDNEAEISSQNVYAFLPIRDYGFQVRESTLLGGSWPTLCFPVYHSSRLSSCRQPRGHRHVISLEPDPSELITRGLSCGSTPPQLAASIPCLAEVSPPKTGHG